VVGAVVGPVIGLPAVGWNRIADDEALSTTDQTNSVDYSTVDPMITTY